VDISENGDGTLTEVSGGMKVKPSLERSGTTLGAGGRWHAEGVTACPEEARREG